MLKKLILTTMLVGVCCVVSAQVTIKGRVLNSETGEPVVGANIRVDHSLQGNYECKRRVYNQGIA